MARLAVTVLVKDYDHLAPLACGDVVAEDLDIRLDRDTAGAIDRMTNDTSNLIGEISLTKHLARLAEGDRSIVGVPIFPTRVFRHRAFYVRRGSDLRSLTDLAGRRAGIDQWLATGSTWSRAAMREQGVAIDSLRWWVGTLDGSPSKRPLGELPSYVQPSPPGRGLRDMLVDGELDVLVGPEPAGLNEPDSPIVRLFPDYRRVEREYYLRMGFYPAHHIFGIRRPFFDREPWVARALYLALEESKQRWQASRRKLTDTTPWIQADIEEATALMGHDWSPNGVEPNRKLVQHVCDELHAQGFIEQPLDGATAFTEFEEVMR
jgi:4,5-dihydroxyphthalate decarboxylase